MTAAVTLLASAACASGSPGPSTSASAASMPPAVVSTSVALSSTPAVVTSAPGVAASTSHAVSRATLPGAGAGQTVVLNPGHNGANASHPNQIDRLVPAGFGTYKACDTTGTSTVTGYPEHAFTFDVAMRVRAILTSHGVHVVMTRTDDNSVGPCVDERAALGNRPGVAAVVSIHADGAPASGHGFHVNQASRRPDGASAATAQRSLDLGRALHAALDASSALTPSTYIGTNGYVYRSDLAGLNLATNPATFVELGNMRNAGDAALVSSARGRQRIADALATGIMDFLRRA